MGRKNVNIVQLYGTTLFKYGIMAAVCVIMTGPLGDVDVILKV